MNQAQANRCRGAGAEARCGVVSLRVDEANLQTAGLAVTVSAAARNLRGPTSLAACERGGMRQRPFYPDESGAGGRVSNPRLHPGR